MLQSNPQIVGSKKRSEQHEIGFGKAKDILDDDDNGVLDYDSPRTTRMDMLSMPTRGLCWSKNCAGKDIRVMDFGMKCRGYHFVLLKGLYAQENSKGFKGSFADAGSSAKFCPDCVNRCFSQNRNNRDCRLHKLGRYEVGEGHGEKSTYEMVRCTNMGKARQGKAGILLWMRRPITKCTG
ncbi:uncharacterized protein LOC125473961 isoform X2 [Pyrus x bretschneideri]|uniref:uncharacterized protein LOC125473961 isoform X2 n=1 Tax=Pyrus x bretschneideri TaxID=225117 RepID=UPI00202E1765|nr:uncharacterized protein LOC125473961 isoform X2 [Pyrus x bretschneideri]